MRNSHCVLVFVAAGGLLACRKPACRGQLTQDDVKALRSKGGDTCSELTRATVKVDEEGIFLDSTRISIFLPPAKKIGVPPLDALLGASRDNWKAIHEGREFAGTVDLQVPAEVDVAPGVSVASAVAAVGYRQLDVRSGEVAARLEWWIPAPQGSRRVEVVHVESDPKTRGFVVRITGEGSLHGGHRHDVADREAATKAIGREWAESPGSPPDALVVRVPNGTFHDALLLVQALRALPELNAARVALEVGSPSR